MPSAPASSHIGDNAGSSGSTRRPRASTLIPRSFQILRPRAPEATEERSEATRRSSASGRSRCLPVEVAERVEAARVGAVVSVEVLLELPAPTAVKIHQARR